MKKQYIFIVFLLTYIGLFNFLPVSTYAEDSKAATGFVYEVIKPENQLDDSNYFNLKMNPGQKQKLQIKFTNEFSSDNIVSVKINGAKTNSNGVVEFGPSKLEKDASLKYDLTSIATAPDKITIPAKGSALLDIDLTMPDSSYDGIITGGIQLQDITNEGKKSKEPKGTIVNKYAYIIGVVLKETDTPVEPDLSLNKVYPDLKNFRNSIMINFSNTQANFLDDMTVDAQITSNKSEEVLYDTKKAGMRMAPNSMIDFPVSMQGEKMIPGDYKAKILVTSGEKKWSWVKEFKITNEQADKFNAEDLGQIQEQGINWQIVVGIIIGVVVLVVIVFFVVRKLSKKGKKKKKKKSKK
ncbi:hypothetical protein A5821_002855 [Enterococcus sp. 7F3_DIV0205]|uniref:DUF3324 domain-containing protein n=1 Tax=Candidatus Enterococcus palustris TaxID=1834189 RepID=A0AAQ3WE24_9ENTE|nr:DUF916 and DUF3324 domain-containing protein [Enterococcus sp. 7F3_DIV0205]OTN83289.1 hypothetical protein A5821_003212 [Enterococcus sp. 7F3_DIV0205]